jgi:solute carrier family 25, member 44
LKVRTRLQVQKGNTFYSGTLNAFRTIIRLEGFSALYKGYLVQGFQLLPLALYITSFELLRKKIDDNLTKNVYAKGFIAGGGSSIIAQTFSVPMDIVSQHMMLDGQKAAKNVAIKGDYERIIVPDNVRKVSSLRVLQYITKEVYNAEGLKGFYRGYFLSTLLMSSNSALWWSFYYLIQG